MLPEEQKFQQYATEHRLFKRAKLVKLNEGLNFAAKALVIQAKEKQTKEAIRSAFESKSTLKTAEIVKQNTLDPEKKTPIGVKGIRDKGGNKNRRQSLLTNLKTIPETVQEEDSLTSDEESKH